MALSRETQEWLDGLQKEGGLSADTLKELKSAAEANSKADEFIKGSVLRQSDYSRNSAEVQQAKKDLEKAQADLLTKEQAVGKFQTDLGTWKTGADQQIVAAITAREQAEAKSAAALARLQRIGTQYGVDPNELNLGEVKVEPKVENNPKYLTEEQFNERVSKGTREAALLDAMIHDLDVQHQELFGTRLKNSAQLVQEAMASGKSLTAYYEEKYKVPEKRQEVAESNVQKRIDEAVNNAKTSWQSNNTLPGGAPAGIRADEPRSPALREGGLPAPTEEGKGLSAAIAAYQTGKYKPTR